jgi:hypothetical protein
MFCKFWWRFYINFSFALLSYKYILYILFVRNNHVFGWPSAHSASFTRLSDSPLYSKSNISSLTSSDYMFYHLGLEFHVVGYNYVIIWHMPQNLIDILVYAVATITNDTTTSGTQELNIFIPSIRLSSCIEMPFAAGRHVYLSTLLRREFCFTCHQTVWDSRKLQAARTI